MGLCEKKEKVRVCVKKKESGGLYEKKRKWGFV